MIYKEALEILDLPPFISKQEIKNRYKELAKIYHPDVNKDSEKMRKINSAYKLLIDYIENYKYSFDENEISKQRPDITHNSKFNF
jgi:DnaJ-class molecular chaperone